MNATKASRAVKSGTDSPGPGEHAEPPTEIPPTGWWQVTRRAFKESTADNVSMLAAGVAFFAFLAIPAALIAALTLYALVADPQTVARQMQGPTRRDFAHPLGSTGSAGGARAAVFSLVGSFAEAVTYIRQRRVAGDGAALLLQFEVGTGELAPDAKFHPHGHVVLTNVIGAV